jgi:adenosylcobinamide kinase / adenosylcobinamide-phosphate guanylyltransferase
VDVVLLGTGSADGWPNPFCACASCVDSRQAGVVRGHTAALVDGRLLIDCGPDVPRAAERHRAPLHDVGLLLLTHAHPDHVDGLALLAHQWARQAEGLVVAGPAAALGLVAPWVEPGGPVTLHPLTAGDTLSWDGYQVRALPAAHTGAASSEALLYDIESPSGARLLYASDTGPFAEAAWTAVRGRHFDVVLLEETFGERTDHGTDHHDLDSFATAARALRETDAISPRGRLIAVHLSHHNPALSLLRRRLAEVGAEVLDDGSRISTDPSHPTPASRVLLLGGARSGKSTAAEQLVSDHARVTYVATAATSDAEMAERVAIHRARRPAHWATVETTDLETVLDDAGHDDVVLVECFTTWLARVLDDTDTWQTRDTSLAIKRIDAVVEAWRTSKGDLVGVSNEVGSGVVPATWSGRVFRDLQGLLNTRLAEASTDVRLVVAGCTIPLGTGSRA